MCLGTFSRLRRLLATSTLYAAVRILAERFLLYRKAISRKAKGCRLRNSHKFRRRQPFYALQAYLTLLLSADTEGDSKEPYGHCPYPVHPGVSDDIHRLRTDNEERTYSIPLHILFLPYPAWQFIYPICLRHAVQNLSLIHI